MEPESSFVSYDESIINGSVGLQLLNMVKISFGWDDGKHLIYFTVIRLV